MIVLHCALHDDLVLWGEAASEQVEPDSAAVRPPARAAGGRASRHARRADAVAPRFPFDATPQQLAPVLSPAPRTRHDSPVGTRPSPLATRPSPFATAEMIAWLPTVRGNPIASTAVIAEPPANPDSAVLAPWLVTARPLTVDEVLAFVPGCVGARVVTPGILIGPDLAFWAEVVRFGGSLVAREQFLPSLERVSIRLRSPSHVEGPAPSEVERKADPTRTRALARRGRGDESKWRARWTPVIAGEDERRMHLLVEQMPGACRALTQDATAPPAVDPESLLRRFLGEVVDALARGHVGGPAETPPVGHARRRSAAALFPSLHDQWLAALRSPDGWMAGAPHDLALLADQVREWHRPIALSQAAPFRLAFRLDEPALEDDTWNVGYLLQSTRDPSLMITAMDVWAGTRAASLLLGRGFDSRAFLLRALGQAASFAPAIEASLQSAHPAGYQTDTEGAHVFLTDTAWVLQQAGYGVMLPAWWTRKGGRARLALRAHVKDPMRAPTGLSLDTLLAVDWQAALGDDPLSLAELERLARFKTSLVKVRGQWVQVSAEDRAHAIEFLKRRGSSRTTAGELLRMALAASAHASEAGGVPVAGVDAQGWFRDLLAQLESREPMREVPVPDGFRGALRPYQARGYSWLAFLGGWGIGACLADDMGLGKTVQALALLQRNWTAGSRKPVLLVCPTSVVGNWQKESARFTPDLPVLVHHGSRRARDHAFAQDAAAHALVISSYALLHRDVELMKAVAWAGVMLDEAQNIKNPETKQAQAARALATGYRVALTGTPVENSVGDLWSIMEFLNPGFLGPLAAFRQRFLLPIQTGTDPAAADRLKRFTGPFVLRRMKTDRAIIADLPEKQEMKVFCTLTREQASLYGAVVRDAERALRGTEGIKRKGVVLATLSKLKQVCNHPAQFLGEGGPLAGRSGKLARLTEMLEEVAATGDRALVFSQFAEMGTLLKRHLEATFGREVPFLHGGVAKDRRDRMVERFQAGDGESFVFVLSLKAGGTGLNLTAANHVFLFDRWWNPAVENQAIDRTFRIGQRRNVQVHKYLCAGTLEERIDEMLERKLAIASRVVGTGEAWLTELSTDELRELFALRAEAVAE